jgi:hypothetical protein
MFAHFKETLRHALHAVNPFYRNPIVYTPDWQHIQGTKDRLPNPHLGIVMLSSLLTAQREFVDLMRELHGSYVMIAVVEEVAIGTGVLRANIYPLASTADNVHVEGVDEPERLDTTHWDKGDRYYFTIEAQNATVQGRATLSPIQSSRRHFAYYNPWDPLISLSINLDRKAMCSLGFTTI